MKKTLLLTLPLLLLAGCTVVNIKSGHGTQLKSYTVAWPWLDTTKQLDKASVRSTTNTSSVNIAGYSESEQTSTNSAALLQNVTSAVVGAAVKAALGK